MSGILAKFTFGMCLSENVSMQLSDRYGSPMLEEIEAFSRSLYNELEAVMGEEAAGAIALEASSPVSLACTETQFLPPDSNLIQYWRASR